MNLTAKIMSSEKHPIRAMRKQITRQKTDFQNLHQTLLNREQTLSEALKLLEEMRDKPFDVDVNKFNQFLAAHKEGK